MPVIVQDAGTSAILALASMDRAALVATLTTGRAHYRPSDDEPWSGCATNSVPQMVTDVRIACDGQSLVIQVQPSGPICQTGGVTCFDEVLSLEANDEVAEHLDAPPAAMEDVAIQWSKEAAEGI